MSEPTVDVVIVSYRSRDLLGRCLESLREHPAPAGMTVTVVDNASGDGTADYVAAGVVDHGHGHPGRCRVLAQRLQAAPEQIARAVGDDDHVYGRLAHRVGTLVPAGEGKGPSAAQRRLASSRKAE